MFVGGCLLFSSSRTQKLVSLSSAEAEVYSCSSGVSDAMLSRLISWMTGFKMMVYFHTDTSEAPGILQRQGGGRVRHLSCRILWLQDLIGSRQIKLATVAGAVNPANIGTKRLPCNRLKSLMCMIGTFDVSRGTLEVGRRRRAWEPFRKKQNVMSILSVLSLPSLKGCDEDASSTSSDPSPTPMAFTVLCWFAFSFGSGCVVAFSPSFPRWNQMQSHVYMMILTAAPVLWQIPQCPQALRFSFPASSAKASTPLRTT